MNKTIDMNKTKNESSKPVNRSQISNDFDLNEYTDSISEIIDLEDMNNTLDEISLELANFDELEGATTSNEPDFAYLPCAAHNIQLVVNDGLKSLSETFIALIKNPIENSIT